MKDVHLADILNAVYRVSLNNITVFGVLRFSHVQFDYYFQSILGLLSCLFPYIRNTQRLSCVYQPSPCYCCVLRMALVDKKLECISDLRNAQFHQSFWE